MAWELGLGYEIQVAGQGKVDGLTTCQLLFGKQRYSLRYSLRAGGGVRDRGVAGVSVWGG